VTNRDEKAAHAAADRAEQDARDAPAKLAVARWKVRQEAEAAEAIRLRAENHGHVFNWWDRRCSHCGISQIIYRDSIFGISGDETAIVCTRVSGIDRPVSVGELRRGLG
jgi:hypothetical protein